MTDRRTAHGTSQSVGEVADIIIDTNYIDKSFRDDDTLPHVFVAVNMPNLPRDTRRSGEIAEILARLTKLEMKAASIPYAMVASGEWRGCEPSGATSPGQRTLRPMGPNVYKTQLSRRRTLSTCQLRRACSETTTGLFCRPNRGRGRGDAKICAKNR